MTEGKLKAKLTLQFTEFGNRVVSFDVTDDDFHNKTLFEIFIEHVLTPTSTITETHPAQSKKTDIIPEIPERSELENYIKSQPNYRFTVEGMLQHLYADIKLDPDDADVVRWINAIRTKVKRIRDAIEKAEGGHWNTEQEGRNKVYSFVKDNGGDVKQSQLVEDITKLLA